MFDGVARRYDLTNTVLSLGQDRYWRRATRSALRIGPGQKVLDLAAGTAVSTAELTKSGAWCVAADFSVGMLAAGGARKVPKVAGDATRLPFGDGVFDAVTISFGLRNVADPQAALREMARVTRPGGRLVVCEFSTPTNALVRHRLQGVSDAGIAAGRASGVQQPRRLRLPGGVDQGVARAGDAGASDFSGGVVGGAVAQPDGRHRGLACWLQAAAVRKILNGLPVAGSRPGRGSSGRSRRPGTGTPGPRWCLVAGCAG